MIKNAILEVDLLGWVMFIFNHLLGGGSPKFYAITRGWVIFLK